MILKVEEARVGAVSVDFPALPIHLNGLSKNRASYAPISNIPWFWRSPSASGFAPCHLKVPDPLPGTSLQRHGPPISDLRHHDEAISLQRLLLWPYGDEPVPWLVDKDLVDAIENWLSDPWWGERLLEGA